MTVKSVTYLPEARFAYPATYHELPMRSFYDVVMMLVKSGYRCLVYQKTCALLEHYSGRRIERRYISVQR